jgi:hypothetical protein
MTGPEKRESSLATSFECGAIGKKLKQKKYTKA